MSPARSLRARSPRRVASVLAAGWSLVFVAGLFLEAIVRLGARFAVACHGDELQGMHWASLPLAVALFCYGEGYLCLQRRFAPVVVVRAFEIASRPVSPASFVTAPLYALSLVGGDRRAVLRSWAGVAGIAGAIVITRCLPGPWRAVVDAGVASALGWGLVAVVATALATLSRTMQEKLAG